MSVKLKEYVVNLLKRISTSFHLNQVVLLNQDGNIIFIDKPKPIDSEFFQDLTKEIYPMLSKQLPKEKELEGFVLMAKDSNYLTFISGVNEARMFLIIEMQDLQTLTQQSFQKNLKTVFRRIDEMMESEKEPKDHTEINLDNDLKKLEELSKSLTAPKFLQFKKLMEYLR